MSKKSVGLIILWWGEVIIALRVLLFSVPVMINKYSDKSFSLKNLDDRFIIVVSWAAVFYFVAGVVSIGGARFWKGAHTAAAVLVCLVTIVTLRLPSLLIGTVAPYYFLPVIAAIAVSGLLVILKGK